MLKNRFFATLFVFMLLILSACGNGDTDTKTAAEKKPDTKSGTY